MQTHHDLLLNLLSSSLGICCGSYDDLSVDKIADEGALIPGSDFTRGNEADSCGNATANL